MKKKKTKKLKTELQFPKQLTRENLFYSPIWYGDEPGFVNELIMHLINILKILKKF